MGLWEGEFGEGEFGEEEFEGGASEGSTGTESDPNPLISKKPDNVGLGAWIFGTFGIGSGDGVLETTGLGTGLGSVSEVQDTRPAKHSANQKTRKGIGLARVGMDHVRQGHTHKAKQKEKDALGRNQTQVCKEFDTKLRLVCTFVSRNYLWGRCGLFWHRFQQCSSHDARIESER